jgi:hypothetical protein
MCAVLFSLVGCAGNPVRKAVALPPVAPVKASVAAVKAKTRETADATTKAKESAGELVSDLKFKRDMNLGLTAEELNKTFVDLTDLFARIDDANTKAKDADARAEIAGAKVQALEQEQERTQASVDKVTTELATATDNLHHQTWLAWKWRLIAIGTWIAIAGLFVAKMYFKVAIPFL